MNSVGDLSSGVGVLGNSHKFGYHFRMLFKTMSAIGCAVACLSATAIADDLYKFLNEIPIGGEGGWDILTIDAAARRLYLSHAAKVTATLRCPNSQFTIKDTAQWFGSIYADKITAQKNAQIHFDMTGVGGVTWIEGR